MVLAGGLNDGCDEGDPVGFAESDLAEENSQHERRERSEAGETTKGGIVDVPVVDLISKQRLW